MTAIPPIPPGCEFFFKPRGRGVAPGWWFRLPSPKKCPGEGMTTALSFLGDAENADYCGRLDRRMVAAVAEIAWRREAERLEKSETYRRQDDSLVMIQPKRVAAIRNARAWRAWGEWVEAKYINPTP